MDVDDRDAVSLDWLLADRRDAQRTFAHDRLLVIVRLPDGRVARTFAWMLMPLRLRIAARRMSRAGARGVTRLACYPDADSPTLVYEIATPAARYAERCLLPAAPAGSLTRLVRAAIAAWSGCDPTIGAVILMGSPS